MTTAVKSSNIKDFFHRKQEVGLLSFEAATLLYILVSTVIILIEWKPLSSPWSMLGFRGLMIIGILATNLVYRYCPCKATVLLRVAIPFLGLIYWYPETYQFCSVFEYKDHIFAHADYLLFGYQPSLLFSRYVDSTFWYELFSMGYFSYYFMMIAMILFYFIARYEDFQRASFVFLASFFLFYLIFDFLPVAGPQYYYCANGEEMGSTALFPEMGHYFRDHTDILPLDVRGIFSRFVLDLQEQGENPTAAFPSSHVGMALVTVLLARQTKNKTLFWILFTLFVILCFATVYLKAHYVVDSLAGLLFGGLFFYLCNKNYPWVAEKLHLKK